MPRYHVIALLINFQLSTGIAILTGLKSNVYYKCIFINFFNVVKYIIIFMYTWKIFLGTALILFPSMNFQQFEPPMNVPLCTVV